MTDCRGTQEHHDAVAAEQYLQQHAESVKMLSEPVLRWNGNFQTLADAMGLSRKRLGLALSHMTHGKDERGRRCTWMAPVASKSDSNGYRLFVAPERLSYAVAAHDIKLAIEGLLSELKSVKSRINTFAARSDDMAAEARKMYDFDAYHYFKSASERAETPMWELEEILKTAQGYLGE